MDITLRRFLCNREATLGVMYVDGEFMCFTLEDAPREKKILGRTRIPEGEYKVGVRTESPMAFKYANKFDGWHVGMLEVLDVPLFTGILIHIGNTVSDTEGCLLVGMGLQATNLQAMPSDVSLIYSTQAYEKLYKKTIDSAKAGTLSISILNDHS